MPAPTNTLLIEGSFTELCEELAQYLNVLRSNEGGASVNAEIAPLLEPLRQQEQNGEEPNLGQRDEVLKKIVAAAAVLNNAPEKEFIPAYNLLVYLIQQSSDPDIFLSRICFYLSKPVTSSAQFGPSLALTILTTIFNTLAPSDSSRYHVFLAIVAVIRQSGSTTAYEALKEQLVNQLPNWLASWELDEEDAQKLHLAIADAAEAAGDSEFAHAHIVEALQAIDANEASSKENRELAVRALTSALAHPAIFDFTSLSASDAVQALRSSDTSLFELLEIFAADTLDAYDDFISSTPLSSISGGVLADSGDALQTKMRLLTLTSLASSTPSRSLPYAAIASALRVADTEVEKWVIDTIRAGLVEGKLSQLRSEFLVHRATYRVFGEKQWAEVQGRLFVWRRSLEGVLGVIRTERERYARELQQQQAAAQAAEEGGAVGKGGDKKSTGDRRRHQQHQSQPHEVDLLGEGD
ncbi:PCI domain protein [Talaromyces stipitatus ATCC 10500]|uniref:Eukaryotic translation initiation factor 3 subunit M n=1 Tax=Talaromyces stipitatus (strain ATCC 10500 / CBS 375.48 / QM 6759 / NRRL 1006) TaxID=441959 RepID=B8LZG2_TALSN|nr:PCI domain protein [Talaromyces stipitatus ATCC 10500]EED21715.1 PCI domain protein [Talaromyces stipitatus ATCC 10500]